MNTPSISVVMANYNHGHFLGQALTALLSQSLLPTEIVIVDDASTDNSVDVIAQFQRTCPLIKLIRNETNLGGAASAHKALINSSGELIVGQSADDQVLPGYIEKSVAMLTQYPQAGLCVSDPASFIDGSETVAPNPMLWSNVPAYFAPGDLAEVIKGGFIPGHASVIRRQPFLEAGGHIAELQWHSDWFANLVIAFRHGLCYIPEPLAAIREHETSYSHSGRRNWTKQAQVLTHLLDILHTSRFADVVPYFIRGSILSHFDDQIVRLVMDTPHFWDPLSLLLIQRSLWVWSLRTEEICHERRRICQEARPFPLPASRQT